MHLQKTKNERTITRLREMVMEREHINEALQYLPLPQLMELCRLIEQNCQVEHIRKPTSQTMLLPVKDPVTGGSFYGGEILATSSITRVNGWSMVLDDQPELALAIAVIDAAFAAGFYHDEITVLVENGFLRKTEADRKEAARAEATRVQFDLL